MESSVISAIILGITGIVITGYYSYHSKEIANDKMMKELFKEFNHRYDDINNHLLIIENDYPTMDKLTNAINSAELKQKIIDYFNLCAEEFFWYNHKHRIDSIVWKSWEKGMNYWYNNVPAIKQMWEDEIKSNGEASYYIKNGVGFFNKTLKQ